MNELKKNYLTPSKLNRFLKFRKKPFIQKYVFGDRPPQTKAKELGQLRHERIKSLLSAKDKNAYLDSFIVKPDDMRRGTKSYKAFLEEHEDKTEIDEKELRLLQEVSIEVATTPELMELSKKATTHLKNLTPELTKAGILNEVEFEKELYDDSGSIAGIVDIIDVKSRVFYEVKTTGQPIEFFSFRQGRSILYQCLIYQHLLQVNFTDSIDWTWKWILISTEEDSVDIVILDSNQIKAEVDFANRAILKDIKHYREFYTNLHELLGYEPILNRPDPITLEHRAWVYDKLKNSEYFKPYFTGGKMNFNSFEIQQLAERGQ